jgi:CDP-archaeol synthase
MADEKHQMASGSLVTTRPGRVSLGWLSALWAAVCNQLCSLMGWPSWDQVGTAALFGALLGLAYVVFELPNSFIKRRIDIAPGRNGAGPIGLLFILIDQVDSVLGCLLVASLWFDVRWGDVFAIIVICGGVHLVINQLLYLVGLKRQRY